jgi:PPOX class probable F420-dependent enzyme
MADLPRGTHVSLTTLGRTGQPVPTSGRAAPDGDLVVRTRADSGEVERLRHATRVTVAPCDVRGPAVGATAGLLDRADRPPVLAAAQGGRRISPRRS